MESALDTVDVTDRAVSLGYVLPEGWTVTASTLGDDTYSDPRESGDVYRTDIDEDNYDDPAHGFCKGCGKWMHKATADEVAAGREAQMVTVTDLATGDLIEMAGDPIYDPAHPHTDGSACSHAWAGYFVVGDKFGDAGELERPDLYSVFHERGSFGFPLDHKVWRVGTTETGATVLDLHEWVTDDGNLCPESGGAHELDEPATVKAWREGKWQFVTIVVKVLDADGMSAGFASLGGTESGYFPVEIDPVTGGIEWKDINPLTDPDHPTPDMIREAIADARGSGEAVGPCVCGTNPDPADETKRLTPDTRTCGSCGRVWCGRCNPTPASRCPYEAAHGDYVSPGHVVDLGDDMEHEVSTPDTDLAGLWSVRLHQYGVTVTTVRAPSLAALLSTFAEITSDLAYCMETLHEEPKG